MRSLMSLLPEFAVREQPFRHSAPVAWRSCFVCVSRQIKNAVEEQRKITQLRFTRLLEERAPPTAAEGSGGGGEVTKQRSLLSRL